MFELFLRISFAMNSFKPCDTLYRVSFCDIRIKQTHQSKQESGKKPLNIDLKNEHARNNFPKNYCNWPGNANKITHGQTDECVCMCTLKLIRKISPNKTIHGNARCSAYNISIAKSKITLSSNGIN